MQHTFNLDNEDSLIVIPTLVDDEKISLVLDTGASHTIIDLTKLLIMGYRLTDSLGVVEFETAKGIVQAYIFKIKQLKALGKNQKQMTVCSYDFLGNNVLSDIDGVLGLDFLKNTDLLISFKNFFISLEV
jgi:predicted aspartyl protease